MLKYELKKIYSKKINQIVFVIILLIAITLSCFAIGSMRYVDKDGNTHTGVKSYRNLISDSNKWAGILTEDKIVEIVKIEKELAKKYNGEIPDTEYGKTMQSYEGIKSFIVSILTPNAEWNENVLKQLTNEQANALYTTYKENMQKMAKEYGKNIKQQDFLTKQYSKVELPLNYELKDSWETMTLYAQTFAIILAIFTSFLVAGIFAEEFQTRAESVFFSTKYGRSKATKNKIISGVLITTMVYWISVGIMTLILISFMGTNGFNTPYQISEPYSMYYMTYGGYYLLTLLCGYIGSLFSASITMLVTTKMRNANIAICIPFFLFCVMPFIGRALSSFTTFFRLTPNMLMNVVENAKDLFLFQIGNIIFRPIPFIMLFYTIISMILLPLVYKNYHNYGLKKKNN